MIAIPYASGSGTIARMAELIGDAGRDAGQRVELIDVSTPQAVDWGLLQAADAILFGTPTYMGGPAAPFKAFMDATGDDIWVGRKWSDKIAGGFTSGVNTGGDKLATLQALNVFAMQHGMIWVGQDVIGAPVVPDNSGLNLSGTFLGLAVNSGPKGLSAGCEASCQHFGARLAGVVARWQVGNT